MRDFIFVALIELNIETVDMKIDTSELSVD